MRMMKIFINHVFFLTQNEKMSFKSFKKRRHVCLPLKFEMNIPDLKSAAREIIGDAYKYGIISAAKQESMLY